MAIDPDEFDIPVQDYDFSKATQTTSLIDQMALAGGFTATKLATARDILLAMRKQSDAVDGDASKVTNWLSFPACLCATGTRSFFIEAVKTKMFNVLSTTCGTLDHDIARSYKDYYHGAFELDDIELGEHSLMRLGNVIVPNSSYGEIIEAVVMPALEEIYQDRLKETGKTGADAWIGFGSIHLVWELGKRIGTPNSLIFGLGRIKFQSVSLVLQMDQLVHNCSCSVNVIVISISTHLQTSKSCPTLHGMLKHPMRSWLVEAYQSITSFGGINTEEVSTQQFTSQLLLNMMEAYLVLDFVKR